MSVAVIVPVYNGDDVLLTTVPSVLALDGVDEWVWVDDGSTDASAQTLAALVAREPRARVVRQPHNLGRSAARNRGIGETSGETLVFFDCDVRPPAHTIRALLDPVGEGVVASVALIRPMLEERDDPYAVYLTLFERGPARSQVGEPIPWRFFLAGACAIQRRAVNAVGGFDPSVPYGEDVALACHLAERHPDGLALADVRVDLFGVGRLDDAVRNVRTFGTALREIEASCPNVRRLTGVEEVMQSDWHRWAARVPVPALAYPLLETMPRRLRARAVRYLLGHALLAAYHGV